MKLKVYKYKINGIKFNVGIGDINDNSVYVEVNGTPYTVEMEKTQTAPVSVTSQKRPAAAPRTESGEKVISKPATPSNGASAVKSPLPGTIMSLKVKVGDVVKAGDTVCVLEAMKMENDVHTIIGGTIKNILVNPGDTVLEGTDLMIIE